MKDEEGEIILAMSHLSEVELLTTSRPRVVVLLDMHYVRSNYGDL